jgi:ATP-dependent DNA helicase RecG
VTVNFDTPLARVVGKGHAKLARELDLHTVRDLLFHLPRRYEQRGSYTDIRQLKVDEQVTVQARVLSARSRPMRNRAGFVLEAVVTDDSGGTLTSVTTAPAATRSGNWPIQNTSCWMNRPKE